METKCLLSVRASHSAVNKLMSAQAKLHPHITLVPPFIVTEPDPLPSPPYHRVAAVTEAVQAIAQELSSFEVQCSGLRDHPTADRTARVISLSIEASPELEQIRSWCRETWREKINSNHLFPFHLTLAQGLSAEAARQRMEELLVSGQFEPFALRVHSIDVHYQQPGGSWKPVSCNSLVRVPVLAE